MRIAGSKIVVDNFRAKENKHFVLSHYHADHYVGLTRKFMEGVIYCTQTTANLVMLNFKIPRKLLKVVDTFQTVEIEGSIFGKEYLFEMTFYPANHCPGAVIIYFCDLLSGRSYLHTGDFRYDSEVHSNLPKLDYFRKSKSKSLVEETIGDSKVVKRNTLSKIYLDTTYCRPKLLFTSQAKVIDFVADVIQKFENKVVTKMRSKQASPFVQFFKKSSGNNPDMVKGKENFLYLVGTYSIGKEKILLGLAKKLGKKIYVTRKKYQTFKNVVELKDDLDLYFTTNLHETNIQCVSMSSLNWKKFYELTLNYSNKYDGIVGFRPSCFPSPEVKATKTGKSSFIVNVPYSEHSSFWELVDFLGDFRFDSIVPHVFNDHRDKETMVDNLEQYLALDKIPKKEYQLKMPKNILKFTKVENSILNYVQQKKENRSSNNFEAMEEFDKKLKEKRKSFVGSVRPPASSGKKKKGKRVLTDTERRKDITPVFFRPKRRRELNENDAIEVYSSSEEEAVFELDTPEEIVKDQSFKGIPQKRRRKDWKRGPKTKKKKKTKRKSKKGKDKTDRQSKIDSFFSIK